MLPGEQGRVRQLRQLIVYLILLPPLSTTPATPTVPTPCRHSGMGMFSLSCLHSSLAWQKLSNHTATTRSIASFLVYTIAKFNTAI